MTVFTWEKPQGVLPLCRSTLGEWSSSTLVVLAVPRGRTMAAGMAGSHAQPCRCALLCADLGRQTEPGRCFLVKKSEVMICLDRLVFIAQGSVTLEWLPMFPGAHCRRVGVLSEQYQTAVWRLSFETEEWMEAGQNVTEILTWMLSPQNTPGVMTYIAEDGLLGALGKAITLALKDSWPWDIDICCLKIIPELLQKAAGFENTMHQVSFIIFRLRAGGTNKSPIYVNVRKKSAFFADKRVALQTQSEHCSLSPFCSFFICPVGFVLSVSVSSCVVPDLIWASGAAAARNSHRLGLWGSSSLVYLSSQ